LMSNKAIQRSYGCFLKFSYFLFLRKIISSTMLEIVEFGQGILGIFIQISLTWIIFTA
jgi:hypothetical protein